MEKKKIGIFAGVAIGILIIIAAITVTLVLVLKHHKQNKSDESEKPLQDVISDNSTFPDGTYQIPIKSVKPGLPEQAPLFVNVTMLSELGLRVDNSSLIAETNRLSYFFVRLPPVNGTDGGDGSKRVKRQLSSQNQSIGIQFGDSDTLHVIPLDLSLTKKSGVSLLGTLPDKSQVYQVEVRMGDAMCENSDDYGSCSIVDWTPYWLTDDNTGTKASFKNKLPVACGSQCNSDPSSPCFTYCSVCDGQEVAGADTPVTRRYNMSTREANNIKFLYETYTVKDRVIVSYEGETLFDSGCVGTEGEKEAKISFKGKSMEIRVDVEPNCSGTSGTAWYFLLPCAECKQAGIDVSHFQSDCKKNGKTIHNCNPIDWQQVKAANISFAIAKATQGDTYKDPSFLLNWNGMVRAGIEPSAYHFFNGSVSAGDQYKNIKDALFGGGISFDRFNHVLAIDVENVANDTSTKTQRTATLWLLLESLVVDVTNIYIYTGPSYWDDEIAWQTYPFETFPLWISNYGRKEPRIPKSWKKKGWTWWQYSETGKVNGVQGSVDLDVREKC